MTTVKKPRTPAQKAAARNWMHACPKQFEEWKAKQPALPPKPKPPPTIFDQRVRDAKQRFIVKIMKRGDRHSDEGKAFWAEIVQWINEPGNMEEDGKLAAFSYKRVSQFTELRFSREIVAFRFKMRFG